MSKKLKIIISIIVIILLLICAVGGFFWWQWKRESEVGFVWSEKFEEKELNGEKIIKDKKSSLLVKIPNDWHRRRRRTEYNFS